MSWNAFVISNRLVINERALREVRSSDDDTARALAIGSAGDVVSCSSRLKGRNGFDGDWRLGKQREKLRELWLHLGYVAAEIVEDLLRRGRDVFGIGFERGAEGRKIGEALFFGDRSHLCLDPLDLAETELVDLLCLHVSGGPRINVVFVALLAFWQGGNGKTCAAPGRVLRAQESREGLVGGDNIRLDGIADLLGQTLLIFSRNARRILFGREKKGVGVNDSLTLHRELLYEETHRHEVVLHAGAKHFGGLAQHARNLVETCDVVLVVLDGIEGNGKGKVGKTGMDAILLIDRHLVFFEVEIGDALLQHADQEIVRELILIGETRSRDGLEPGEEFLVDLVPLRDSVE